MHYDWATIFGGTLTAALVATAVLLGLSAFNMRRARGGHSIFGAEPAGSIFLFDAEALVDATPSARALIASGLGRALPRALARLEPLFPGLTARLDGLADEGRFVLHSDGDVAPGLVLRAEWVGGLTRLTVITDDLDQLTPAMDGALEAALRGELSRLRELLADAPLPIWREDDIGRVVWANRAYVRALADFGGDDAVATGWPLAPLFDRAGQSDRRMLRLDDDVRWYEIARVETGDEALCYARPADALVKAETDLQQFTQTLTKTFAQLSIGLAVFDARRVLQVFNPALLDLTGLPVDFLISQPTLPLVLDAMRERQTVPEPASYRDWRRQISRIEEEASAGHFQETWALPSGRTHRVTGRPHPNGALAFVIEDISGEVMQTRRHRADRELGQAVIDATDDAVVVFGQDGAVIMSNAAAARLWGAEGLIGGDAGSAQEPAAIRHWRTLAAPTLFWGDLVREIGSLGPRAPWESEIRLADGRALAARVSPMPNGATLVGFRVLAAGAPGSADLPDGATAREQIDRDAASAGTSLGTA